MGDEIVNKVAQSVLITFDLEDLYVEGVRTQIDLSQWLEQGFILREKEFRASNAHESTNIYPEYRFKTPSKYSGSFAYVFGQKGLISVDYTQVNYDKAQFDEPNDDFLNQENEVIIQNVNAAGILRVGGEYRFGNYSIRAGYIKQGATLKNFDNSSSTKSIGGGINFGGSSLDLSIVSSEFRGQQQLFSTGLTDAIDLKRERFTIGLTYTLKL